MPSVSPCCRLLLSLHTLHSGANGNKSFLLITSTSFLLHSLVAAVFILRFRAALQKPRSESRRRRLCADKVFSPPRVKRGEVCARTAPLRSALEPQHLKLTETAAAATDGWMPIKC